MADRQGLEGVRKGEETHESTKPSESHRQVNVSPINAQPSYGGRSSPARELNSPSNYWFAGGAIPSSTPPKKSPKQETAEKLEPEKSLSPTSNKSHIIVPIYDDTNLTNDLSPSKVEKKDAYWFAHGVNEKSNSQNSSNGTSGSENREGSPSYKERELRVRQMRERQEEERHKKLDEIKQASIAHQNYRQQFEMERRRRIEEARTRDHGRQQAVLERRKQIVDAEMERREALLKRKMERETKLEAKKNAQRNQMSFAFGSSTPRLYETYEIKSPQSTTDGGLSTPNGRRSTSLNRKADGEDLMTKSCTSLSSTSTFGRGRRKTDLRPTQPRERDALNSTPRSSGGAQMRGAISMSRLDQLAQPRRRRFLPSTPEVNKTVSPSAKCKSMSNIAFGLSITPTQSRTPRTKNPSNLSPSTSTPHSNFRSPIPSKSSPNSAASSNLKKKSCSMVHLASTPRPTKASKMRADAKLGKDKALNKSMYNLSNCMSPDKRVTLRKISTEPRPKSSMSDHSATLSQVSATSAPSRMRQHRPRPLSMVASVSDEKTRTPRSAEKKMSKTPRAKSASTPLKEAKQEKTENSGKPQKQKQPPAPKKVDSKSNTPSKSPSPQHIEREKSNLSNNKPDVIPDESEKIAVSAPVEKSDESSGEINRAKPKITSEEEAKALLAEKRRIMREKAEREAQEERLRQEKLRLEEEERARKEEQRIQRENAEAMRLAEEYRKDQEEKLRIAIEIKKKQEEEDKIAQEAEAKIKAEREEAERLLKEETDRQRKEKEEKLKQEEEERALRRKKVEAIMSRTRGRTGISEEQKNKTDSANFEKNSEDLQDEDQKENKSVEITKSEIETEKNDVSGESNAAKDSNIVENHGDNSEPGSLDSSSSVNTVIFNGSADHSDIHEFDSLASCDKQQNLNLIQTNGHHDDGVNKSSESSLLLNLNSSSSPVMSLSPDSTETPLSQSSQHIDQLIDLNLAPAMTENISNIQLDNSLFIEDLNSNVNSSPNANPFIAFEDNNLSNKQDSTVTTDLLA